MTAVPEEFNEKRKENLIGYNYKKLMNSKTKIEIVKELNPVFVIEDMPDMIKLLSENQYLVFYPTFHEYTKDLNIENAIGFDNWKHLYDLMNIFFEYN